MEKYKAIRGFLDEEGKLTQWPSKKRKAEQKLMLQLLAEKFDTSQKYSEKEVNELLNQHHTFKDPALMRREMIGHKILKRTTDCRSYWINPDYMPNLVN